MKNIIENYKRQVNEHLDLYLSPKEPKVIWDAMRYSVLADGKRLRPIFAIETAIQCSSGKINIEEVMESKIYINTSNSSLFAESLVAS